MSLYAKNDLRVLLWVSLLFAGRETALGQPSTILGTGWGSPFFAARLGVFHLGGAIDLENAGLIIPNSQSNFGYATLSGTILWGDAAAVQAISDGYNYGSPPWSGSSGIIADYLRTVDPNDVVVGWADNNDLGLSSWGGVTGISTTNHTLLIGATLAGDRILDGFNLTPAPEPTTLALLTAGSVAVMGIMWRRRKAIEVGGGSALS
jgi:hypothetical protein